MSNPPVEARSSTDLKKLPEEALGVGSGNFKYTILVDTSTSSGRLKFNILREIEIIGESVSDACDKDIATINSILTYFKNLVLRELCSQNEYKMIFSILNIFSLWIEMGYNSGVIDRLARIILPTEADKVLDIIASIDRILFEDFSGVSFIYGFLHKNTEEIAPHVIELCEIRSINRNTNSGLPLFLYEMRQNQIPFDMMDIPREVLYHIHCMLRDGNDISTITDGYRIPHCQAKSLSELDLDTLAELMRKYRTDIKHPEDAPSGLASPIYEKERADQTHRLEYEIKDEARKVMRDITGTISLDEIGHDDDF